MVVNGAVQVELSNGAIQVDISHNLVKKDSGAELLTGVPAVASVSEE